MVGIFRVWLVHILVNLYSLGELQVNFELLYDSRVQFENQWERSRGDKIQNSCLCIHKLSQNYVESNVVYVTMLV